MNFQWKNFCVLADELRTLQSAAGVEDRLRTSISRGYYGVFHMTRTWLQTLGHTFDRGVDVHQDLVQLLRTSPNIEWRELGEEVGRLRRQRNFVDYQDEIVNLAQLDSLSLALRDRILARLAR